MSRSTAVPVIEVDGSRIPIEIVPQLPLRMVIVVMNGDLPLSVAVSHEVIAEAVAKGKKDGLDVRQYEWSLWETMLARLDFPEAAP